MAIFGEKDYKSRLVLNISLPAMTAVVILLLCLWLSSDISRRALLIQEKKNNLASRAEKLESLAALKSDFLSAKPYFSILENILPTKDQLIKFPRVLSDLARENKINFGTTFGEETKSTETSPGSIAFSLSVAGSYDKIVNFIKTAESGSYILSWSSIDIRDGGDGSRGVISGKVFSQ